MTLVQDVSQQLFISVPFLSKNNALEYYEPVQNFSVKFANFPPRLIEYPDVFGQGIDDVLISRIEFFPFNLFATAVFVCAVVHILFSTKFLKLGAKLRSDQEFTIKIGKTVPSGAILRADFALMLGKVEVIFGIWAIVLGMGIVVFADWATLVDYIEHKVNFTEPVFVTVVMVISLSRPILKIVQTEMERLVDSFGGSTVTWWFFILTILPILGSFVTPVVSISLASYLLAKKLYSLEPSRKLAYGSMSLLFVNISAGASLSHFALPSVQMVAVPWDWDLSFMIANFGWKAVVAILINNLIFVFIYRKDFEDLSPSSYFIKKQLNRPQKQINSLWNDRETEIPLWITMAHVLFLIWTLLNAHYPKLLIGGLLFFLGFIQLTKKFQYQIEMKAPICVGFFLAGALFHGSFQTWWIEPILHSLAEMPLLLGVAALSAFIDNASITYASTLLPGFYDGLKYAVVAGAISGGGLTVLAHSANIVGHSKLNEFFKEGISQWKVFSHAILPTFIVVLCFMLLQ